MIIGASVMLVGVVLGWAMANAQQKQHKQQEVNIIVHDRTKQEVV